MAVSSEPCPTCGRRGAQLIRRRPTEDDFFCESCLTQFVVGADAKHTRINFITDRATVRTRVENDSIANVYRQGQHICSIYDTEDQQISVAAEYVGDGLRRGERCMYVVRSTAALKRFRNALNDAGINADEAVRSGALVQSTHARVHLAGGHFDCERMLSTLNNVVESALNDGFKGLRTCGDMSWLLVECEGREQSREYEALLNQFFCNIRAVGMCQYDRKRLGLETINDALATHSSTVIDGHHRPNPLYGPRDNRHNSAQRRVT